MVFTIQITPIEKQIIELIANGKKVREIADTVYLSQPSIHKHIFLIKQKSGCNTHAEIVRFAFENKLLTT